MLTLPFLDPSQANIKQTNKLELSWGSSILSYPDLQLITPNRKKKKEKRKKAAAHDQCVLQSLIGTKNNRK